MSKARDLANAGTALGAVDATELGYLDGVTSAVQTQVDAKIAKTLTTTTGDIIYASGANTPARLGIGSSAQVLTVASGVPSWATPASASPTSGQVRVNTEQTTTSTGYAALTTAQAVTVTTGTKVLVIVSASMINNTGIALNYASFAISGATTRAADDSWAAVHTGSDWDNNKEIMQASYASFQTVTAGSNTFTAQFRVSGTTGTFKNRQLIVIDLGS